MAALVLPVLVLPVLVLVVLLWPALARGQATTAGNVSADAQASTTGTIRGKVTDKETGAAVAGATVVVVGTDHAAISDANGEYVIEGIPPGRYQVEATTYSNASASQALTVLSGQESSVDLAAASEQFAGEVIIVTGTRSPEKVFDAPVTVESISAETLARTGGPSYLSALANVKGIDYADAGLGDQRISARGFTTQFNSRMITLVDGRLATLPGSGLPQGNLLPTAGLDMKAMEVVVGPASALYGPNAHTGVINVITKSPWDETGVAAAVRVGNQNVVAGSLRLAGTVEKDYGWKMNIEYLQGNDFKPDCTSNTHNYNTTVCESEMIDDYEISSLKMDGSAYYRRGQWYGKAVAGYSLSTGFALTNLGRNYIRDWEVLYQAAQLSSPDWYVQVTHTSTDAGKTCQIGPVTAAYSMLAEAQQTPEAAIALCNQNKFIDSSELVDSEVQYRREIAGVKTAVGAQWRMYLPDSGGTYLADAIGTDLDTTEIGGYAQLDYRLLDEKLRLVGAARVDNHSNYATQFSPNALAVYSITPEHNLRAGYKRAFKSPTVLENYLFISNFFLGNRDGYTIRDAPVDGNVVAEIQGLEPEKANVVEIGYKGVLGRKVFVDAVVHNSWYENFISPLTQVGNPLDMENPTFAFNPDGTLVAGNGFLFTYQNFGEAQVRGVDIGVSYYPIEHVTLSASGSWLSLVSFSNEDTPLSDLLLNVPTLKFKGSVGIDSLFVPGSFAKVSGRYQNSYEFVSGYWNSHNFMVGDQPLFGDGKLPSRFVADITAGYTIPRSGLTFTGFITNVLGNKDVDVLGAPPIGRVFYLQMGYKYASMNF